MAFDWEKYKEEIAHLYLTERLTLVALRRKLWKKYSTFHPSISSYRTKLREWGYLRRNDRQNRSQNQSPITPADGEPSFLDTAQQSGAEEAEDDDELLSPAWSSDRRTSCPTVTLQPWQLANNAPGSELLLNTPQTPRRFSSRQPGTSSAALLGSNRTSFGSSGFTTSANVSNPTSPVYTSSPSTSQASDLQSGHKRVESSPRLYDLDHIVDDHGNTVLHDIARDGPSGTHLANMMRRSRDIGKVNSDGETFFHVLDPSRMQDIKTVENFLNLCLELGYNFSLQSAENGVNDLNAIKRKWPGFSASLEDGPGFRWTLSYNFFDAHGSQEDPSSLLYPQLPNLEDPSLPDFLLYGGNDTFMNDTPSHF